MGKHKEFSNDLCKFSSKCINYLRLEIVESQKPKAAAQFGESKQLVHGS